MNFRKASTVTLAFEIGVNGTKCLADALRSNKASLFLHSLNFHFSHYHVKQTLKALHLVDNDINNEGTRYIADALENNTVIPLLFF
jgi:hypothetical protein